MIEATAEEVHVMYSAFVFVCVLEVVGHIEEQKYACGISFNVMVHEIGSENHGTFA